jgi:hypothetical protein
VTELFSTLLSLFDVVAHTLPAGKTTAAKLYARLLKELGVLSEGEVREKAASDFVGSYIGQSEEKTRNEIANAKGRVLLIDEVTLTHFPSSLVYVFPSQRQSHLVLFRLVILGVWCSVG